MRPKLTITEQDKTLCERVKDFLDSIHCDGNVVNCDKDQIDRVQDFCIEFRKCNWFRTEWYNCNAHLAESTANQLNYVLMNLKEYAKDLGICAVRRRGFGIIFDARK